MTGLFIALLLALFTGAGVVIAARVPIRKVAPIATALLLGLAGYAWQGSPDLAGKPVVQSAERVRFDEALARKRAEIGERISGATRWMVLSDGYARRGDTQNAVNIFQSGLREFPDDANLWVGLGNALVIHANGTLTPAADYAFRRALTLQPQGTSPNYFYGLALAESGEFERSRVIWQSLSARLPKDFALREELVRNLQLLDALIERRDAMSKGGNQGQ